MQRRGKKYRANAEKVVLGRKYELAEALAIIDKFENYKFDETIEMSVNLGVDPKQTDQVVRGATVLPHGIGKNIRIAVVAKGEAEKEARDAGADIVGNADLIEKIEKGWLEFDKLLATPDTIKELTKVARVLGPKGLMPNTKTGTVTAEIGKAILEQKKGKVEFRIDKSSIVHGIIGKKSFGPEKLKENFLALYDSVLKAKPSTAKGVYVRGVAIAPTMGPGLRLDTAKLEALTHAL